MKKTLHILVCLLLSLGTINAQTDEQKKKIEASTSPKINPELIDQFFNEVHKDSPYKMSADRKKSYLEQLSRFSFIYSPYVENKNHTLLSTIEKKDKYNKNMDYSLENFKPESFNFIKYRFNFYKDSDQYFRVDNQDYLIRITVFKK